MPEMSEALFRKIKDSFEKNGGVIRSSGEIDRHLDSVGAEAATYNENTIIIKSGLVPGASALFEELIHTAQYKSGRATGDNWIDMEIEAKEKLVKHQKSYGIPDVENEETKRQLRELIEGKRGRV